MLENNFYRKLNNAHTKEIKIQQSIAILTAISLVFIEMEHYTLTVFL